MKSYVTMLLLTIAITMSPLLAITYAGGAVMENHLIETQEDSLQSISSVVSRHIYDFYNSQEMTSHFLAETGPMQMLLRSRKNGGSKREIDMWTEEVNRMLSLNSQYNRNVNDAILIDSDGVVVASSDPINIGTMRDQTEMYQQIMGGSQKYFTPSVGKNGDRNLILTIPVNGADGELLGMFQREINFSNLNLYMNQVKIGKSGYVYVIGPEGMILYHGVKGRNTMPMGEFQSIESLDELVEQVADGKLTKSFGIIRYTLYGQDITAAYKEIPELKWVVVSAITDQEIVTPISILRIGSMEVAIVAGGLFAWAGFCIIRRWRKQINMVDEVFCDMLRDETAEKAKMEKGAQTLRPAAFSPDKAEEQNPPILNQLHLPGMMRIVEYARLTARELRRQEERVRYLEETDPLTRLYNKEGISHILSEQLHTHRREAVILIDLDGLRTLNEEYGFDFGDAVLAETGTRLRKYQGKYCVIARIREDKFFIYCRGWYNGLEPERIAEQIRTDIENIRIVRRRRIHMSASIGICYAGDLGDDQRRLFEKKSGRGT